MPSKKQRMRHAQEGRRGDETALSETKLGGSGGSERPARPCFLSACVAPRRSLGGRHGADGVAAAAGSVGRAVGCVGGVVGLLHRFGVGVGVTVELRRRGEKEES